MPVEGRAGTGDNIDVDDDYDDGHHDDDDDYYYDVGIGYDYKVRPVIAENPWLKNDKKRLTRSPHDHHRQWQNHTYMYMLTITTSLPPLTTHIRVYLKYPG